MPKYEYYANPIYGTTVDNPRSVLRRIPGAGLESYSATARKWQYDVLETVRLCGGNAEHEPITEEQAMSIIDRWNKEANA